ncbi:MAG: sensor histidine kinase [Cellulophaga sp.]
MKTKHKHNPLIFNVLLMACSFLILLFIFSSGLNPVNIDYIYTTSFLITTIAPLLLNFYILVPHFLKKEKHLLFLVLFTSNLALSTFLAAQYFKSALDSIFTNYYFVSYFSDEKLLIIFNVFLIVTTLIFLTEDWFYSFTNEKKTLKLANQRIKGQLNSLRSQINPHFLFNSLNVIYSLTLEKKEKTKDAIVQLSDILRYIIYDSDKKTVSLKNEIDLITNYISFQKFRKTNLNTISVKKDIIDSNYQLHPMLLLPLVENCFKHGLNNEVSENYIRIQINQNSTFFKFEIENNFSMNENDSQKTIFGIGLTNIKKNLELVYPNNHTFSIQNTNALFKVKLEIKSIISK